MSQREFELYLSFLSRFLRLDPNQREEIADELRDHLDERLEELIAEGLSRDDAIHRALSEFGDAADLAAHFTHIANRRKRRLLMRCTVGTVITTAAVILIATAFWPQHPAVNGPLQLVAQDRVDSNSNQKQPAKPKRATKTESPESKIERALDQVTELELIDMPLEEVIDFIRDEHKINIILDKRVLEDSGVDPSEIVNYQLSGIKLRSALKIILENLTDHLTYIIEDEVMKITTLEEAESRLSIQVYPVGDLLEGVEGKLIHPNYGAVVPVNKGGTGGGSGGGFFSVLQNDFGSDGGGGQSTKKQKQQPQSGGMAGGFGFTQMYRQHPGEALITVIVSTVQPESWPVNGGFRTIEEFNGLLVARASQDVHREIKNLLEMLRKAAKENKPPKKAVPTARRNQFGGNRDVKPNSPDSFDPNTAGDFNPARRKPTSQFGNDVPVNRTVPEAVRK